MELDAVLIRDFDVVDADWSPERMRQALRLIVGDWIVVRNRGRPARFRAVRRLELLEMLEITRLTGSAIMPGLERQLHQGVTEAEALSAVEAGAFIRSPVPLVVVDAHGPMGIVPVGPELDSFLQGRSAKAMVKDAAHAAFGSSKGGRKTRGGTMRSIPAVQPGAGEGEPASGALMRYVLAELPQSVVVGNTVSLIVSLSTAAQPGVLSAPVAKPVGTKIDIVVKGQDGLSVQGHAEGTLEVSDPQLEQPLQFKLRAEQAGVGVAKIYAFCNGVSAGTLRVTTTIASAETLQEPTRDTRASAEVVVTAIQPPQYSLWIFERGNELSFRLSSADGVYHNNDLGRIELRGNPREHFLGFFSDIENLPLDKPEQRRAAAERVAAKGEGLFEAVFPNELKVLLWNLRDRIETVQITSDEPWIPWEVCKLTGEVNGRIEDGPFFAEAFNVTRWIHGASVTPRLRLAKLALVVPDDSKLLQAPAEKEFVLGLRGDTRTVTPVPARHADVLYHLRTGSFDAWHFTGHARGNVGGDANLAAIELSNREELRPEDFVGRVENALATRPLIFLNACQSSQSGLSLTGAGGWASRFVSSRRPGFAAGAFVGSYWSVYDAAALDFAKAFYGALLAKKPIGQAGKEARLAIRHHDDPTWLAYTIYADPYAQVA